MTPRGEDRARFDLGGAGQAGWETDDHTHAFKGMIAGACLSAPIWIALAWVVGLI